MDWIVISVLAVALMALCVWLAVLLERGRKAQWRFQILAQVATVSDAAGSLEETFDAICDILVPDFADFCAIDVIEEGAPRRAALRVASEAGPEIERGLFERKPSVPESMVVGEDEAALRPRFFERISEQDLRELSHDERDFQFLRGMGVRSAVTVALQARRQVKGALTLGVAWSGRRYRPEDAHFAWILSGRVALALDNSGLFADLERAEETRAEIAETLQHGLLPSPLPHIPGWSLAAMYRPAGAENEVGGDFYDAIRVSGGWMLVIGDVTGRGARAASITGLARYTLRTAAELTDDPLVALRALNRALLARNDASLCSIAALRLSEDPAEPVRAAIAGHSPPLLVDGDVVSEASDAGPVLGAFDDVEWAICESPVGPGQQLVLVTDGIVEAGNELGRFGEERLRSELVGAGSPAHAVQRLEAALRSFTAGALDDDVAVLAVSRSPSEPAPSAGAATLRRLGTAIDASHEALVGRLFHAFNQRDAETIVALCSNEMEFVAVTAEEAGRQSPYSGSQGLRDYLADVERIWEELLITPSRVERRDDQLLVIGRVYVRSRELGIRDMPVAWIWRLRDGLFVRGEVFTDPEAAVARFSQVPA